MNPLVSIIVPIYNRPSFIKQTLPSILNQTYTNWECLIIDDSSTDNTTGLINECIKCDRVKLLHRPKHLIKGANSCRNFGFNNSNGDFIMWFDSDDVMNHNLLLHKIKAMNDFDAVSHVNNYANSSFTHFRDAKTHGEFEEDPLFYYATDKVELQTCSFLWRKEFLMEKYLFDETLSRYQDNDFHIRMLSNKPNIKWLNEILATIRVGDSHVSQISSKAQRTTEKIYDVAKVRYRSLRLASYVSDSRRDDFKKIIANKLSWNLYETIKSIPFRLDRIVFLMKSSVVQGFLLSKYVTLVKKVKFIVYSISYLVIIKK